MEKTIQKTIVKDYTPEDYLNNINSHSTHTFLKGDMTPQSVMKGYARIRILRIALNILGILCAAVFFLGIFLLATSLSDEKPKWLAYTMVVTLIASPLLFLFSALLKDGKKNRQVTNAAFLETRLLDNGQIAIIRFFFKDRKGINLRLSNNGNPNPPTIAEYNPLNPPSFFSRFLDIYLIEKVTNIEQTSDGIKVTFNGTKEAVERDLSYGEKADYLTHTTVLDAVEEFPNTYLDLNSLVECLSRLNVAVGRDSFPNE